MLFTAHAAEIGSDFMKNHPHSHPNKSSIRGKTRSRKSAKSAKSAKHRKAEEQRILRRRENILLIILVAGMTLGGLYLFLVRPYHTHICNGVRWYQVCMPTDYAVHGLDISHYQGRIHWESIIDTHEGPFPLQFVFMKATEGETSGDSLFADNFASARRHGLIRGAYHYFHPTRDPRTQADFYVKTVALEDGDLPPVLDVEVTGDKDPRELRRLIKIWLDRVEAHYGTKPILYASYKFKMRYLNDPIFDSYPYWIAHYYVDSVEYPGKWHFWQHSDKGRVEGIPSAVDLDIFNGSLEELLDMTLEYPHRGIGSDPLP